MNFVKRMLYVPKHEKIPETTMTAHAVVCVAGILLCLAMLSMTTWAWFNDSAVAGSGTVQTADYNVNVTITSADGSVIPEASQGVHCTRYSLPAGEYTVSLLGEGSAQYGYCKLVLGEKEYYTEPLLTDDAEPLVFTVKIADPQTLDLYSNWGSHSGSDVIGQGVSIAAGE